MSNMETKLVCHFLMRQEKQMVKILSFNDKMVGGQVLKKFQNFSPPQISHLCSVNGFLVLKYFGNIFGILMGLTS